MQNICKTFLFFTLISLLSNGLTLAQHISAGQGNHNVVVKSDGTVWAWGQNNSGQLGNGTTTDSNIPVAVDMTGVLLNKTITQVAAGDGFSIALDSDGKVYSWGYNYYGQLGNGTTTNSNVPVEVDMTGVLLNKTITQIAAGDGFSLALDSDGKVYSWGYNYYGQLGNGTTTNSNIPVAVNMTGVLLNKTITKVAAGDCFSLALDSDGKVYAWGQNSRGQLGNGTTTDSNVPVAVDMTGVLLNKTITKIAAGKYHSIALGNDGKVYSWGYNYYGQLGNNSSTDSNVPVEVDMTGVLLNKTITQVNGSLFHSIALDSDGKVYTWGSNFYGELGDNTTTLKRVPVAVDDTGVLSGKTITQADAGAYHSISLGDDGTIYTWGWNSYGQLGNNSAADSHIPVEVDQSVMGVLPVELTSFTANVVNGNVLLTWETETEVDNYGFQVERKKEIFQSKWENIGFVQGHGNSNSPRDYSFIDDNPSSEKLKYRLKQIDTDGSFEYSDIIEIETNIPAKFELFQNYPNPFNPTTTIKFSIPGNVKTEYIASLKIYNSIGQQVAELINKPLAAGNYKVKFDGENLSSGIYFYTLQYGNFKSEKKMILLK